VHDACLEADLDVLPNGDMTEVGERVRRRLICSGFAIVTHERDAPAGYITFWWTETTC
jgi:hypothetical protein